MRSALVVGLAALVCGGWPLPAQSSPPEKSRAWQLEGLRSAFCLYFLVEPAAAARELARGYVPVPAARAPELHPALSAVVTQQPEFGTWSPSSLCLYYLAGLSSGGRREADDRPDRPRVVGIWSMAARPSERRADGAGEVGIAFFANSGRILDGMRNTQLERRKLDASIGKVPDSSDDRYALKLGKTRLTWDGHPTSDSTRVEGPVTLSWLVPTQREDRLLRLALSPKWSEAVVGALKIEGKDDFAKILKASPIRFVGRWYRGGAGRLELQ